MALIKDLATFQKFFRVSFSYNELKALPPVAKAEGRYIQPIIGSTVLSTLQAQVDASSITWNDLHNCICAVTAPLSVLTDLARRHIKLTDAGMKKSVSESTESVYKWEFLEVKDELIAEVSIALDELWKHLYEKGDDYEWSDPNPYDLLFKTADDFSKYYPLHQPFRVFGLLKPIMWEVEDHFIPGMIGEDFFLELKDLHVESLKVVAEDPDAEEPSEEEVAKQKKINKAIELLKKAVAYYTAHKAVDRLPVKLTSSGFTVLFSADADMPNRGEKAAPDQDLDWMSRSCLREATTYVYQLKAYLNINASADLFSTYFNSDKYEAPATVKENVNAKLKGLFKM
jgi:hypothetical protein